MISGGAWSGTLKFDGVAVGECHDERKCVKVDVYLLIFPSLAV